MVQKTEKGTKAMKKCCEMRIDQIISKVSLALLVSLSLFSSMSEYHKLGFMMDYNYDLAAHGTQM